MNTQMPSTSYVSIPLSWDSFFWSGVCPCSASVMAVGDLAHLGIHSGAGHDHSAASVDGNAAHVAHIFSVAERNVAVVGGFKDAVGLFRRNGFSGKCGPPLS